MTNKLSFDDLTPVEFEEFCCDLLQELGFRNLNWRKGTGLSASPSDSGRDIECEYITEEVGGKVYTEKWFVECKHQKRGVPPTEIQGILNWAMAKRPDKALNVVSGLLSNPCKDSIDSYIAENKPPFRIEYWELKDLARITPECLLVRYGLSNELKFVEIMHPLHLKYITQIALNTLDERDHKKLDELFDFVYHEIINSDYRLPAAGMETLDDLIIGEVDYDTFKEKCYSLKKHISDMTLVRFIVNSALGYLFNMGNKTESDTIVARNKIASEIWKGRAELSKGEEKNELMEVAKIHENLVNNLPKQTEEHYSLYIYFCEEVLSELMKQTDTMLQTPS